MLTDEERGPLAAWLRRERVNRKWKVPATIMRLQTAAPGVSFGNLKELETGKAKPNAKQRVGIEKVYGAIPDFTAPPVADTAALVKAIEDQTAAINDLVREIRNSHEAPAVRMTGAEVVRLLADLARLGIPDETTDATDNPGDNEDPDPDGPATTPPRGRARGTGR